MLALSSLNKLLSHVLIPPALHTAILFTASGDLVSYASITSSSSGGAGGEVGGKGLDAVGSIRPRPKDDIRVLVGLASEVWAETREDGEGMVDSELGKIIVLPIVPTPKQEDGQTQTQTQPPKDKNSALLIALNATDDIEWGELQHKAQSLASHLSKPLTQVQARLDAAPLPPSKTGRR